MNHEKTFNNKSHSKDYEKQTAEMVLKCCPKRSSLRS